MALRCRNNLPRGGRHIEGGDVAAADLDIEALPAVGCVCLFGADGRQVREVADVVHRDVDAALIWAGLLQRGEGKIHGGFVEDVGRERRTCSTWS
jgi:hypothetical protein